MDLIEAGPGDQSLLLELMREFYAIEGLDYNSAVATRALHDLWNNSVFGRIYLIRLMEETVGYIVLTFGFSLEFRGRDALVDEFYVREPFRRRGLGSECLRKIDDICRGEGIPALHLEVDRTNLPVKEWYHRMGFVDHDRHLLTKWLDAR